MYYYFYFYWSVIHLNRHLKYNKELGTDHNIMDNVYKEVLGLTEFRQRCNLYKTDCVHKK